MHIVQDSSAGSMPRTGSVGCWTGLVADMQMLKTLSQRTTPESYLEQYPRQRARALNTWLARFGMYSNGVFFELDRRGSGMVKELIMRSKKERGYVIRVTGVRKDNKIKVQSALEIVSIDAVNEHEMNRQQAAGLRREFAIMRI